MTIISSIPAFLILLTILVFFHELGHYWIARKNGVKVDVFSVGFGPELFGFYDKNQTRWKFSIIPLGGYVKMFGDADVTSSTSAENSALSPEELKTTFKNKSVGQRAAIVAAGPIANFILAIVLFTGLYSFVGQPYSAAVVAKVMENSAAEAAGFQINDKIIEAAGTKIDRFEQLQRLVQLGSGEPIDVVVERNSSVINLTVKPKVDIYTDHNGREAKRWLIGIQSDQSSVKAHDFLSAFRAAVVETYDVSIGTFKAIGQIFNGHRSVKELGGPIQIAKISGMAAEAGIEYYIGWMAVLSINLGLLNLLPVPMLDGGHLLFYIIEAVSGKPLNERAQEYCFRIGLTLVLSLMLFVTWNDLWIM
ncbi:RIP metalloprotease RseP [Kiloniella sp. EL199]|uniref:RIP metalloprotease RseP n=1 Tax=Kiloniella sp. EL199 TaxID=2107581 RepID=UPI000EA1C519|nr:RIP metalloprotease RseP [Kiloniella sp. EL199]